MKWLGAFLAVVSCCASLCLGASESITNDTGQPVSAIVIVFSEPVRLVSYDTSVFRNQDPLLTSETFSFFDGVLQPWQSFRISWTPSSARIKQLGWIAEEEVPDESLLQAGIDAYQSGAYDQAITLLRERLDLYTSLGDDPLIAECLFYIGLSQVSLLEYREAISSFERAARILHELPVAETEAMLLNNLGMCYYQLSDYHSALEYHQRALAIRSTLPNPLDLAMTLQNLGNCYYYLADYATALESFTEAKGLFDAEDALANSAMCLSNSGLCHLALGTYDTAFACLNDALTRAEQLHDDELEAMCLNNLGNCYSSLGDYGQAIECYNSSLQIRTSARDMRGAATSLDNLGLCYREAGDYETALEYHERSLDIRLDLGDQSGEAISRNNLGNCYYALAENSTAIDEYLEALSIFRKLEIPSSEATVLNNLGLCYWISEDIDEAVTFHQQSLKLSRETGNRIGIITSLNNLGDCYYAMEQTADAAACYDEALRLIRESSLAREYNASYPEALWRVQVGLAECHRALGDLPTAIPYWEAAIAVIEGIRGRVGTASLTPLFMREKRFVYEDLVPALLSTESVLAAFMYAERSKARTLVDMMETAVISHASILPHEIQNAGGLIRASEAGNSAWLLGDIDEARSRSSSSLGATWTQPQYRDFLHDLQERNAALGDTLSVDPARIDNYCTAAMESLNRAIALEYLVTDRETIVWVISELGVQTASRILVTRDELAEMVRAFRETVESPPPGSAAVLSYYDMLQKAAQLYQLLVAPIEGALDSAEHVIIIPSDVLFYVPFGALYRCEAEEMLYHDAVLRSTELDSDSPPSGRYIIEDMSLSYAPSLASLYWPLQHSMSAYTSILAVGNPTGDLPSAEDEAKAVANLFAEGKLFLGGDATESTVKVELLSCEYDVVHLSTHGSFRTEMPLLSEVILQGDSQDDGHLYAGEILGLPLYTTELVVLSACQTALPLAMSSSVVAGDEIQGLGQALFVAGVPTAILSLWNVSDVSTSELMMLLYTDLLEPTQPADALSSSQRTFLGPECPSVGRGASLAYTHPYYWAAFVLYGLGWNCPI